MDDLISRQVRNVANTISLLSDIRSQYNCFNPDEEKYYRALSEAIKALLTAQPEITDEQAIEHLQSTGWMQNHDREMYESGLREQLADDSGSYDSLIPCEDTISRQAAVDAVRNIRAITGTEDDSILLIDKAEVQTELMMLPSAQPERAEGEWVQIQRYARDAQPDLECPFCKHRIGWFDMGRYCAGCGSKLKGGAG